MMVSAAPLGSGVRACRSILPVVGEFGKCWIGQYPGCDSSFLEARRLPPDTLLPTPTLSRIQSRQPRTHFDDRGDKDSRATLFRNE